jgi:hypothetical protein
MFNPKLNAHGGFTPAALTPPKYDTCWKDNTALSRSTGAVWGTGTAPYVILPVLWISNPEKRILQS